MTEKTQADIRRCIDMAKEGYNVAYLAFSDVHARALFDMMANLASDEGFRVSRVAMVLKAQGAGSVRMMSTRGSMTQLRGVPNVVSVHHGAGIPPLGEKVWVVWRSRGGETRDRKERPIGVFYSTEAAQEALEESRAEVAVQPDFADYDFNIHETLAYRE